MLMDLINLGINLRDFLANLDLKTAHLHKEHEVIVKVLVANRLKRI